MGIKEELKEEKHKIVDIKKSNSKTRSIRNMKICGRILNHVWPFVLAGSLTVGIMSLAGGGLPFQQSEVKKRPIKKETFDSYGEETSENIFDEKLQNSYIYFSDKACLMPNGNGIKHYAKYTLNGLNCESLEQLKNGEISFTDLLGKKIEEGNEVIENITQKELEDNNYYKAVIFSPSGESILVRETSAENFCLTLIQIIATVFLGMSIDVFRGKFGDKWNENTIKNIMAIYPLIDEKPTKEKIKSLKKELVKEEN